MMMEHNLAPCPLCGGTISLEMVSQSVQERRVHMKCSGCGMEFLHTQYYAGCRKPIGRRFEDIWNGRASNDPA